MNSAARIARAAGRRRRAGRRRASAVACVARPARATAATSEGLACDTDAQQHLLAHRRRRLRHHAGRQLDLHVELRQTAGAASSCPARRCASPPGRPVTVVLHNTLPEPTSIVFPGQTGVKADGNPAQPQFDTAPATLTSMVQPAAADDGSVTYTFTAGSPGTYLYETGTDVDKQMQMGLYGALVVRPAGHPDQVNDRADSAFNPDHEYVFLLSEVDPDLHLAVERGEPVDWTAYTRALLHDQRPQHAGHAGAQQRLVAAEPAVRRPGAHQAVRRGHQPAAGDDPLPQRRHGELPVPPARQRRAGGQPRRARARRGRPAQDLSYLKYDIDVQPGQTVDVLMDWRDVEHWNAGDQPDPDAAPGHHRPAARRHRHLVQREPATSGTKNPLPDDHHRQQRVRRVLPHRPQPRAASRPPTTARPSAA